MIEALDTNSYNATVTYAFRFGTSEQIVHLNQRQLDLVPYLYILVAHKDDFSSIQNDNGEYLLNYPIEYTWFMSILRAITSGDPYTLFNELSQDENILDTLRLLDYLAVKPFPLPFLLAGKYLVLSNLTNDENEKPCLEYHQATLFEARQTAAEFIIAVAKNEYKLSDISDRRSVFSLINIILFHPTVFNSRFRHHTLAVAKKRCYSYFSKTQQRQLQTTHRISQYKKIHISKYLSDDQKYPPSNFQNTFTWRVVDVSIKNTSLAEKLYGIDTVIEYCYSPGNNDPIITLPETFNRINDLTTELTPIDLPFMSSRIDVWADFHDRMRSLLLDFSRHYDTWPVDDNDDVNRELLIKQLRQNPKKEEAQSAREGWFNTLPKRPKIDKFKRRSSVKVQKHR